MFTLAELDAAIIADDGVPSPEINVVEYTGNSFEAGRRSHEGEVVNVHRAPREKFASSLAFWCKSINLLSFVAHYGLKDGGGLCTPLSEADTKDWIATWIVDLPAFVPPRGKFTGAILLREEINERACLVETELEYVSLFWMTRG
jgi:hypothetical protein